MHMVTTDAGIRAYDNSGDGATEAAAKADAEARNARAAALGLKTRYITAPFVSAKKG